MMNIVLHPDSSDDEGDDMEIEFMTKLRKKIITQYFLTLGWSKTDQIYATGPCGGIYKLNENNRLAPVSNPPEKVMKAIHVSQQE